MTSARLDWDDVQQRLSYNLEQTFRQDRGALDIATLLKSLEQDRSHGSILLALTAPVLVPLPPGAAMILALPLLVITPQLAIGRRGLWLPDGLLRRSLNRAAIGKLAAYVIPGLRWLETIGRPRLLFLTGAIGRRFLGLVACLLALILVSPMPLSTLLPGLALLTLALGLMRRDGLLVLGGYVLTSLAVLVVVMGLQGLKLILKMLLLRA